QVGDVVDLVGVQGDGAHQVDLQLVAGGQRSDQLLAGAAHVLADGQDRRDVVGRVGVVGGQERVVEVQLTHGDPVGPGGPFGGGALVDAVDARPGPPGGDGMAQRLGPGGGDRGAGERGDGDRGVVDDAVDDHLGDLVVDLDGVDGHRGHLPGQLVLVGQVLLGAVDADVVVSHADLSFAGCWGPVVSMGSVGSEGSASRWVR